MSLRATKTRRRPPAGWPDPRPGSGVGGKSAVTAAYDQLVAVVRIHSPRHLRSARAAHTKRLAQIQERLAYPERPVPGLTTHQAKGGEWEIVGVRLTDSERAALADGLSVHEDTHRKLYVACTRAHRRTVEVLAAPSPAQRTAARATAAPNFVIAAAEGTASPT